jgi:lambda repressor-like predicted transcriptional regulator
MTTNQTTASLIAEALERAERSVSWVAEKAGMAPSTLRRKLRGTRDFTTGEVASIADALGVSPSSLLPPEFRDAA